VEALSHQSLLLVSTYLLGAWSNKINYLTNISMTAREPLLARRDNAAPIDVSDPAPGLSRAGLPAEDPPDLGAS
jgi:hypothetical protein